MVATPDLDSYPGSPAVQAHSDGSGSGRSALRVAQEAIRASQGLDVGDIAYGRAHWGDINTRMETPGPYYAFLAGLVASQGIRRICEIGTHCGGSTKALYRGLDRTRETRVVTVDVTRESDAQLADLPEIRKIVGDAASAYVAAQVLNGFSDTHKVDLLFIDAAHTYLTEMLIYGIYAQMLSPRFVVLDDIQINDQMRLVWEKVTSGLPDDSWLDVSTAYPEVRKPGVGFGLLVFPENVRVPDRGHTITMAPRWKRNLNAVKRSAWNLIQRRP